DCASATELVAVSNEAAQISCRKFLIAALSSFMCQTAPLADAVPRHKARPLPILIHPSKHRLSRIAAIAATRASIVVTHFSAVFMGRYQAFVPCSPLWSCRSRFEQMASNRWQAPAKASIASTALQRIGGGKAVAGDLPPAVAALLEDEKLLVCFGACGSSGIDLLGSSGIRPHISPLRRYHDKLGNRELDLEHDGFEHRVIGSAHRRLADRRLIVRRHEHAVLGVERHDRIRV